MLRVRDLGRMPYGDAFAVQQTLLEEVVAARGSDDPVAGYVLLVEHDPPVITISRRRGARQHLVATETQLAAAGVEVAETNRGGDITYHGPGQLVVYPILDLNPLGLRVRSYMRALESVVIDVVGQFGVKGMRDPDATGVWVDHDGPRSKICAMGVRISRWVSMHGLALNVTTNLDHFDLIVPCGLAGRTVTSLQRELGAQTPTMDIVKEAMVQRLQTLYSTSSSSRTASVTSKASG